MRDDNTVGGGVKSRQPTGAPRKPAFNNLIWETTSRLENI